MEKGRKKRRGEGNVCMRTKLWGYKMMAYQAFGEKEKERGEKVLR